MLRNSRIWTHQKYPRRLNAKEVLVTRRNGEFVFPVADGSAKLSGRDYEFQEPTLRREQTVRSEGLSGDSRRSGNKKDEPEARKDFWSIQGDFVYRHHIEPRVHLYVPKEETFPIPLKYIDVTRSTYADLDIAQEKKELMIIGTSMETEICLIRGQVSRNLLH